MNELLEALGLGPDSLALLHDFLQQHGYLLGLLILGVTAFLLLRIRQKA